MITVFILSLLVVTIVAWTVSRRRHRTAQARFDNLPLLAVPAVPGHIARPTYGAPDPAHRAPAMVEASASDARAVSSGHYAPEYTAIRPKAEDFAPARSAYADAAGSLHDDAGQPVDGASLRFWRAADGTLQFLPGRLEVAAGRDAGQEIRFVRTAGPDGTTITFGRADGAPYRHVQLREPTVSRAHARMSLESVDPFATDPRLQPGGSHATRWRLENLSATNPVIVNGRALAADAGPRSSVILSDGDRIEMGEVAFIFRAR